MNDVLMFSMNFICGLYFLVCNFSIKYESLICGLHLSLNGVLLFEFIIYVI